MCIAAANYLIEKTNRYNKGRKSKIEMTCKRLNKLLYFCDIENMNNNYGISMFNDDFSAWTNGPVIFSVYNEFKQFQNGGMMPLCEKNHSKLTTEMKRTIKNVFNKTKKIDTDTLIEYSHVKNGPWDVVYDRSNPNGLPLIPKEQIYEFYKNRSWDKV